MVGGGKALPTFREAGCQTIGAPCSEPRDKRAVTNRAEGGRPHKLPDCLPCLGDGSVCNLGQTSARAQNWDSVCESVYGQSQRVKGQGHESVRSQLEVSARSQNQWCI